MTVRQLFSSSRAGKAIADLVNYANADEKLNSALLERPKLL